MIAVLLDLVGVDRELVALAHMLGEADRAVDRLTIDALRAVLEERIRDREVPVQALLHLCFQRHHRRRLAVDQEVISGALGNPP